MKALIKSFVFTIMALFALPFTMSYFIFAMAAEKNTLIVSYSQILSLLPGKLGNYFRSGFYRFTLTHCSPDAIISFGTLFSQQNTNIDQGVYIGPQSNIGCCHIQKNCLLGSGVHIMSGKQQHYFADLNTPISEQGGHLTKVTIGENTWIGNGSLVMANIGKNCVVAAGAVVIDEVPDLAIVAGNPAKIIKIRKA
jgi:acetyltransferase-like isoleucine patch superfamily enzyme